MLDMTPETIQIIIQGGAVGLLFAFGCGFFVLARLLITKGFDFITNHLAHNTEAIKEVVLEIRQLSNKLDKGD